jgi:hypothetical protein
MVLISGNSEFGGDVDYSAFIRHIEPLGFKFEGQGTFRLAYKRGKVIIKVPRNIDGIYDNRIEAAAWHKYKSQPTPKGYLLAPCRMLANGCQMMVTVNLTWFFNQDVFSDILHKEDWTYRIEGGQVGMYREKVVAFDFALNIPERALWEREWGVRSTWFYDKGWNNSEFQ